MVDRLGMSGMMQRLVSKVIEQFAGSGVGIDDDGRLCLPDGLDASRTHRFIELVMARGYESPKAAMHDLFRRVGVAPRAIEALEEMLGEEGHLDWTRIGHSPLKIGATVPRFLEIPARFRTFLIDGLGLADPGDETLEDAVVSTRHRAAAQLGCEPCWDAILARPDEVTELARGWRASVV